MQGPLPLQQGRLASPDIPGTIANEVKLGKSREQTAVKQGETLIGSVHKKHGGVQMVLLGPRGGSCNSGGPESNGIHAADPFFVTSAGAAR